MKRYLDACPGDFTSASASVGLKDIVGHGLTAKGSAPQEILDDIAATIIVTDDCDPNPQKDPVIYNLWLFIRSSNLLRGA